MRTLTTLKQQERGQKHRQKEEHPPEIDPIYWASDNSLFEG